MALQEEELHLKQEAVRQQQQCEESRLCLDQRKRELDLETEIAKAEAEERAYAIAELQVPSVKQLSRVLSQVNFSMWDQQPRPLHQPRPYDKPCLLPQEHQAEQPYRPLSPQPAFVEYSADTVAVLSSSAFKSEPSSQRVEAQATQPWHLPGDPAGNEHPLRQIRNCQKGSASSADSSTGEKFLQELIDIQKKQQRRNEQLMIFQQSRNRQLQELLSQHQKLSLTPSLLSTEVQVFNGDPANYCSFVRSFENLIESKTLNNNSHLYYLVQYTRGDIQDLMKSCLSMEPDASYLEARRLLRERYGQGYKIATALVDRLTNGPPITHKGGNALQKFSVQLTSCKNTLQEKGYLNKIENPESLQKVVKRLPFLLRQKWRDVADDITNKAQREITFKDLAKFVEARARALTHPVFGNISGDSKGTCKDLKGSKKQKGSNFATWTGAGCNGGDANETANVSKSTVGVRLSVLRCPLCRGNHMLVRCKDFKKLLVEQRFQFTRSKGLCDNCLLPGHLVRVCPKTSFCKIPGCQLKHSTYLHPIEGTRGNEQRAREEDAIGGLSTDGNSSCDTGTQTNHISVDSQCALIGAGQPATALPIVPVKVKARG